MHVRAHAEGCKLQVFVSWAYVHGTAAAGRLGGTAHYLCGAKVLYGTAYSVVLQWRYRDDSLGRRKAGALWKGEK